MAKAKLVEVRFLSSPTGGYKLAYNAGDVAKLPLPLAEQLIEDKVAVKTADLKAEVK